MGGWPNEPRTIARILKINHAGENGAIRIYGAQIAVAKRLYPDLVDRLTELKGHEITHFKSFDDAMRARVARPCRLMWLSAAGGSVLGLITALLGRRSIWTTTAAVEETVHCHLDDQLHFLAGKDEALHAIVAGIRAEELEHLRLAEAELGEQSFWLRIERWAVAAVTEVLIFMSTSGESRSLRRELTSSLRPSA